MSTAALRNTFAGVIAGSAMVIGLSCVSPNRPGRSEPSFSVSPDTSVLAHDTAFTRVVPAHPGTGTTVYFWYVDGKTTPDHSGSDTSIAVSFGVRDTGIHVVSVKARDLESESESPLSVIHVVVRPGRPVCTASADTMVSVGDTVALRAYGADSNGTVRSYLWMIGNLDTTTDSGTLRWRPTIHDTAGVLVQVRATDNDGLTSAVDTIREHVAAVAPILKAMRDTAVLVGDTLVLRAQAASAGAKIIRYLWNKDSVAVTADSLDQLSLVFTYRDTGLLHTVEVRALDADSIYSAPVLVHIGVLFSRVVLSAGDDTTIAVNQPLALRARPVGADTGIVTTYLWTFDGGAQTRTTHTGLTQAVWPVSDTGLHKVAVVAWGPDSIRSNTDTIRIQVKAYAPAIVAMADTTVAINDTVVLHATGFDTNGVIVRYLWAEDAGPFSDTTTLGLFAAHWPLADTGVHLVRVVAVDNDNLPSRSDTIRVTVKAFPPTIVVPETVTAFIGDTTLVPVTAHDANGRIVKYLWQYGSTGAMDSGNVAQVPVYSTGADSVIVRITARDDDGLTATGTTTVRFTRNPILVQMADPHQDTLLVLPFDQWQSGGATVAFHYRASDSSHAAGRLTFALYLSTQPSSFISAPVFTGPDSECAVTGLGEGRYYWKLAAINSRQDTGTTYGSFSAMVQKRLCFTGHSIVVGYGGDPGKGGFRAMVLDSLRAGYPTPASILTVGPLGTNTVFNTYLLPTQDDFSLSQGGTQAIDLLIQLIDSPSLSADMWILMIGVNGLTETDLEYTPVLIDSMHARNPNAFLYVLNALPLPDTMSANVLQALASFNAMLVSEIAKRKSVGWNIYLVDAFSAVAPDSIFPTALMTDFVHPNQAGYDKIGAAVMKVIHATLPPPPGR